MAELPLYRSYEEDDSENCILCTQDIDNPIELGDKLTYGEITIHHFCAVSHFCFCYDFSLDLIIVLI